MNRNEMERFEAAAAVAAVAAAGPEGADRLWEALVEVLRVENPGVDEVEVQDMASMEQGESTSPVALVEALRRVRESDRQRAAVRALLALLGC